MPAFNLPNIEDFSAIEPVFPDPPAGGSAPPATAGGGGPAKPRPRATRAQLNALVENKLGPLKPLGQLLNTLASPETKAGVVVGPINAISKLGNALGDWAQRKPIDTKDAWQVPEATVRQFNPFRVGIGPEVAPSDQFGFQVGGGIGAEIAGAAVGATLIKRLGQVGQLKRLADAARRTQAVRGFAVAQRASQPLRTAVNVGTNVGQTLVSTTLATPFLDVSQGNLANVGDAFGLKLPGRVDETDDYLQSFGKSIAVEGLAAPLAAMGALSFIGPARRAMFGGEGVNWLDDLAEQELEPYTRQWRNFRQPQLPPGNEIPRLPSAQMQAAADGSPITPATINVDTPGGSLPGTPPGLPQLPSYEPRGGALAIPGSAIERYFNETTQIRQVEGQRQRLVDAGLIRRGENDQWELNVGDGVDPQIEQQIRELQTQRGVLLEQMNQQPGKAEEITKQLTEIDTQVADLTMSGTTKEFLAPRSSRQLEIDLDTRPELDTFLANLDELDDRQLRDIHSRVLREVGVERNAQELAGTQQRVQELNQRLEEINGRLEAGDLTARGAKGLITKTQREIQAAQQQLQAVQQRMAVPETTVGQQLEMSMAWQTGLDLSPGVELPPFRQLAVDAESGGYRTIDEYRASLEGVGRDTLRRIAMPDSSPEVAALVKARTGRRVWGAKKADIIDALVEMAMRRRQYLPRDVDQLELGLTRNLANAEDAPLLDVPADLTTTSRMGQTVDADGNTITVPMAEYQPRGMDPQTREQLKADILRRAIDNGEVQAPVTPIPNRPNGPQAFNQGTFLDDLLSDDSGQMALQFVNDELPPYKAGGKNADALLDEMRLRLEYNILDAKAMQAQKDALMAAHGWDRLGWEEKKRLGLMGRGMFAYSRDELAGAVDEVRPPTAPFAPELPVAGDRAPQPYRGEGSAAAEQMQQFNPELKAKPERKPQTYDTETVFASVNGQPVVGPRATVTQASAPAAAPAAAPTGKAPSRSAGNAKGKAKAKPATPLQQKAQEALNDIQAQRQDALKQLDELRKKHQGGSC